MLNFKLLKWYHYPLIPIAFVIGALEWIWKLLRGFFGR